MPPAIERWGPWVLLFVGAVVSLKVAFAPDGWKTRRILLQWIFGLSFVGLGTFGLSFLPAYSGLLRDIARFMKDPTPENEKHIADRVANEEMPEEYRELASNAVLGNPTPETSETLERAAASARSPEGKRHLEEAARRFKERTETAVATAAGLAERNELTAEGVRKLPPEKRKILTDSLPALTREKLAAAKLDEAKQAALKSALAAAKAGGT